MLGWTILFGLISFSGMAPLLAGHPAPLFLKTASSPFCGSFPPESTDAGGSPPNLMNFPDPS